jgi:hypothetical protein
LHCPEARRLKNTKHRNPGAEPEAQISSSRALLTAFSVYSSQNRTRRDEMSPINPILVTGGSGYIASWVVKKLLEKGRTVHATVRSLQAEQKVTHLLEWQKTIPVKTETLRSGSDN